MARWIASGLEGEVQAPLAVTVHKRQFSVRRGLCRGGCIFVNSKVLSHAKRSINQFFLPSSMGKRLIAEDTAIHPPVVKAMETAAVGQQ